jgi:hypothetical protein
MASYLRVHYIFESEADAEQTRITGENTIVDGTQHLRIAFGMRDPEIIYIRPDGYIGFRTHDLHQRSLLDYLTAIYATVVPAPLV